MTAPAVEAQQQHWGGPQANSLRGVFTRLTDAARTLSRRIADMVQGHGSLSQSHAWLMGVQYGQSRGGNAEQEELELSAQDQEALLLDFHSRVWCTYRRDFVPLGPEGLTSDVGWGCTIRSGQMMMAEVLLRHVLGRTWRQQVHTSSSFHQGLHVPYAGGAPHGELTALTQLLSQFIDDPRAPLSIHSICAAGKPQGVVPGKWLGPWVLCRALCALLDGNPQLGLSLHMVCDPGGGAPTLDPDHLLARLPDDAAASTADGTRDGEAGQAGQLGVQTDVQGHTAGQADEASTGAGSPLPQAPQCERPACSSAGTTDSRGNAPGLSRTPPSPAQGLVLLLPLTLGVGKANPLYYPQLLRVLGFPQTVGIVGGRPSASLFFVGHQDANLLYLDPHIAQPACSLPSALPSYFCNVIRLMPITSIDPSLAIGFYCRTRGELRDLVARLDALAKEHRLAPIVTVAVAGTAAQRASVNGRPWGPDASPSSPSGGNGAGADSERDEWEVL